jgi:hypothetical protein
MNVTHAVALALCLLGGALALPGPAGATPPVQKGETYSALAYLPGNGGTANVTIRFDAYSDERELQLLHSLLVDNGPKAVLRRLEKLEPIGKIQRVSSVSFYDFKVVRSIPTAKGRRIVAFADRPVGFLERYYNSRSTDYEFGVLTLDLDKEGGTEGTGELIYAAKVRVRKDGSIEVENFSTYPVRLLGVRRQ